MCGLAICNVVSDFFTFCHPPAIVKAFSYRYWTLIQQYIVSAIVALLIPVLWITQVEDFCNNHRKRTGARGSMKRQRERDRERDRERKRERQHERECERQHEE